MPLPENAMKVAKINEDERLVFGWASVSKTADGSLVVDSHGDVIEPAELEQAAYDFMLNARESNERHEGPAVGDVVESVFIDATKAEAMGIEAPHTGWWIGVRIRDDETFAKVKSGEYEMFSIEGTGQAEEFEAEMVVARQMQSDVFRLLREAGQDRWGGNETYVYVDDFDLDSPFAVFCINNGGDERMVGVTFERTADGVALGLDEAEVERTTNYRLKGGAMQRLADLAAS